MLRTTFLLICLISGHAAWAWQEKTAPSRTRRGGPTIEAARQAGVTPHIVLTNMFDAIDKVWFPAAYDRAGSVSYRASIDADLPAEVVARGNQPVDGSGSVDFTVDIEGVSAPNGQYHMQMTGGLGEVRVTANHKQTVVASQDFKSFSDTPKRRRDKNANLSSYGSYFRRYIGKMRHQIMESGAYHTFYKGSGVYQGNKVDIVRVYKPEGKIRKTNKRQPINMNKLWTFWQDGSYEIWVYQVSKMPAAVFYSNPADNVYANFTIEYDNLWLPQRFNYTNNSVEAEGSGDLILNYDREKMISGISFKYNGDRGISLRLDATLAFEGQPGRDTFRPLPPFGFRKINRDHLRLMILTQISGGLLKLKKHGINLRNFKF